MFEAILNITDKILSLDEDAILTEILDDSDLQDKIAELNRLQLQSGKLADGSSTPRYDEDPYFKTPKAAKAYEAWKVHVSPNPDKPQGVMDFWIDGTFQGTIGVKNATKAFFLTSDSAIAADVQAKTSNEALGLTESSIEVIIPIILDKTYSKVYSTIFQ